MKYHIVSSHPLHPRIEKDVLPSPRLVAEGTRGPVEAYRTGDYNGKGVWRVRDDSYDPPETEYKTVMVEVEKEKNPWD